MISRKLVSSGTFGLNLVSEQCVALTHPDKLYNPDYWASDGLAGNELFTNQNSNASTGKKEYIIFLEVKYVLTISKI